MRALQSWSMQRSRVSLFILAFIALLSCSTQPSNAGFCAIIPPQMEAPLSYGTYLYLDAMPDQEFLQAEKEQPVRRIPPMEVRTDPAAVEPILNEKCAFSIFSSELATAQKLDHLKSQILATGSTDDGQQSIEYRLFFNPDALPANNEAAYSMTLRYLQFLWSDAFQSKLTFYGIKAAPPSVQKEMQQSLSQYLPHPRPED